MKPKQVYILVTIEERNGEQEYTFRQVKQCRAGNEDKTAERLARTWYSEKPEKDDSGYAFNLGSSYVYVKVAGWQHITPEDAATLQRLGIA